MRVLLTGAAGFIGSHVAEELLQDGHSVLGVDALWSNYDPARKRENIAMLERWPQFRFEAADLTKADLSPLLTEVEVVAHLAAVPGVRDSWGVGFSNYSDANMLGLQRLLEAVLESGTPRLVFASSSSVYGASNRASARFLPRPLSPYGATKVAGEALCSAYQARAPWLDVVMLRYFTVYGPRQRPDMAVARFVEAALVGRSVTVYGDGQQRRFLTYVGDVARLTALAVVQPLSGLHAFDVCGSEAWSVNQMIDAVADLTDREIVVDRRPGRSDDPLEIAGSSDEAQLAFGWRPTTGVQKGLYLQVQWTAAFLQKEVATPPVEAEDG